MEHCWIGKDELISDVLGAPSQRLNDQLEPLYNSSVPIHGVTWKTSWKRWTIETSSEKVLGKPVLAVQHDDDDDDDFYSVRERFNILLKIPSCSSVLKSPKG